LLTPETRAGLGYYDETGWVDASQDETKLGYLVISEIVNQHLEGKTPFSRLPVAGYQLWNSLAWRRAHDTPQAAARFRDKLGEEIGECLEAFEALRKQPDSAELKSALVSELGDVVYCATACATIARADVEHSVAKELLDVYGQAERFPALGDIDLAVAKGMSRRDRLFPEGQYPYFVWSLFNQEDSFNDELDPDMILRLIGGAIKNSISEVADLEPGQNKASLPVPESVLRLLTAPIVAAMRPMAEADIINGHGSQFFRVVAAMNAKLYLFASLYAQHYADSSLTEVIKKNIYKINNRVAEGSLDDKSKRGQKTR